MLADADRMKESLPLIHFPALAGALDRALAMPDGLSDAELRRRDQQQHMVQLLRTVVECSADALTQRLVGSTTKWPYACVVSGVSSAVEFVALCASIGTLVEPFGKDPYKVIAPLRPSSDRMDAGKALNEMLHTDGTHWPTPNDFTCLYCIRADEAGGGRSLVMPQEQFVEAVLSALGKVEGEQFLLKSQPWEIAKELGGGTLHAPVLSDDRVRWMGFTLLNSRDASPESKQELRRQIERIECALGQQTGTISLLLQPGDALFVNNRRSLHARTAIKRPLASQRLLLRAKVSCSS